MTLCQVGEVIDLGERAVLLQGRVGLLQAVARGRQIIGCRLLRHRLLRQSAAVAARARSSWSLCCGAEAQAASKAASVPV